MAPVPVEPPGDEYERRLAERAANAQRTILRGAAVWFGVQVAAAAVINTTALLVAWALFAPPERAEVIAGIPSVTEGVLVAFGIMAVRWAVEPLRAAVRDWPVLAPRWLLLAAAPWLVFCAELLWVVTR